MEHMGSALIALAIVLVVAIAAFSFEPANPLESWLTLAQSYGTARQPSQASFTDQDIQFGGKRGGLKNLAIAAKFDATVDDFGFWLTYKGPLPEDVPNTHKIPGTHVRYLSRVGRQQVLSFRVNSVMCLSSDVSLQSPDQRDRHRNSDKQNW